MFIVYLAEGTIIIIIVRHYVVYKTEGLYIEFRVKRGFY